MKIGIIGAGHVGATLARYFTSAGHQVAVANSRGPDTLADLVRDLGKHAHAATADQAATFGDIVVVAIPFGRYTELPVAGTVGKTVIDTCNYSPERDGHIAELDNDSTTSSQLLQQHLPQAKVVKAFNAMRWSHLREYSRSGGALTRYGIPLSGDDPKAKRDVEDLIEQIGFEPVDAGDLAHGGRKHQPGTPVFAADLSADQMHAYLDPEPTRASPPSSENWANAATPPTTRTRS